MSDSITIKVANCDTCSSVLTNILTNAGYNVLSIDIPTNGNTISPGDYAIVSEDIVLANNALVKSSHKEYLFPEVVLKTGTNILIISTTDKKAVVEVKDAITSVGNDTTTGEVVEGEYPLTSIEIDVDKIRK